VVKVEVGADNVSVIRNLSKGLLGIVLFRFRVDDLRQALGSSFDKGKTIYKANYSTNERHKIAIHTVEC